MDEELGAHIPYADLQVHPDSYGALRARKMLRLARSGEYGLTTGIASMDEYIRLFPATYTIIAAQPGGGKTALAMQLLGHAFKESQRRSDGKRALIFSAEMTDEQLAMRDVASITNVSVWDQLRGNYSAEQENLLEQTYEARIKNPRYHIDACSSPDAARISSTCEILSRSTGLSMIVLDYIELASTDEKFKAEHVRAVGKMCKEVAKTYDCPVVALSQINKDNTSRADKKPTMTDIRYGGHEIADAVIILKENDEAVVPDGINYIEAHIVKNRNGPGVGKVAGLLFNGKTMTFKSASTKQVSLNQPAQTMHKEK